jgi:hypothetical protein
MDLLVGEERQGDKGLGVLVSLKRRDGKCFNDQVVVKSDGEITLQQPRM